MSSKKLNKKYLSDKRINAVEKDAFSHKSIADQIYEVISLKDTSYLNIGIFGKWGVGKSSIVDLLKLRLDNELDNTYQFIPINVWKYREEKSIRRKFIYETANAFGKLDEVDEMYQKKQYDRLDILGREFGRFTKKLMKVPEKIIYLSILMFTIFWVLHIFIQDFGLKDIVTYSISAGAISTSLYYAFLLIKVIVSKQAKIEVEPFESEEQFEHEFINMLDDKNIKEILKVFFIDDLDRCTSHKVINTLETIKTFFDIENCVFIIACDPEIIKRAVIDSNEILGYTEKDGSYYLEKFFQHFVYVPPFIPTNMRDYTKNLIIQEELTISNDLNEDTLDEIVFILSYKDVINPRKVIVLVNSFIMDFYIASDREKDINHSLPPDSITKSPYILAILTIMKHDFPFVIDDLIKYPTLLDRIRKQNFQELDSETIKKYNKLSSNYIRNNNIRDQELSKYPSQADIICLEEFVDIIGEWTESDITPYLFLSQDSDYEPEHAALDKLIRNGSHKEVLELLKKMSDLQKKQICFIGTRLEQLNNKKERRNVLVVFTHVLAEFGMPKDLPFKKKMAILNRAYLTFIKEFNNTNFDQLNISGLYVIAQNIYGKAETEILEKLMTFIENDITHFSSIYSPLFNNDLFFSFDNPSINVLKEKFDTLDLSTTEYNIVKTTFDSIDNPSSLCLKSFFKPFLNINLLKLEDTLDLYNKIQKNDGADPKIVKEHEEDYHIQLHYFKSVISKFIRNDIIDIFKMTFENWASFDIQSAIKFLKNSSEYNSLSNETKEDLIEIIYNHKKLYSNDEDSLYVIKELFELKSLSKNVENIAFLISDILHFGDASLFNSEEIINLLINMLDYININDEEGKHTELAYSEVVNKINLTEVFREFESKLIDFFIKNTESLNENISSKLLGKVVEYFYEYEGIEERVKEIKSMQRFASILIKNGAIIDKSTISFNNGDESKTYYETNITSLTEEFYKGLIPFITICETSLKGESPNLDFYCDMIISYNSQPQGLFYLEILVNIIPKLKYNGLDHIFDNLNTMLSAEIGGKHKVMAFELIVNCTSKFSWDLLRNYIDLAFYRHYKFFIKYSKTHKKLSSIIIDKLISINTNKLMLKKWLPLSKVHLKGIKDSNYKAVYVTKLEELYISEYKKESSDRWEKLKVILELFNNDVIEEHHFNKTKTQMRIYLGKSYKRYRRLRREIGNFETKFHIRKNKIK